MKENSIKEDITRIKQRIEDVKEYIEYGLSYSEYLDLENSFDNILSDYKRVLKENEELKIIKSAIQTLQINSLEEEKYIVISKGSFLDGSYKHLLDDYIPIQKVKEKIEELDRKITYIESQYTNGGQNCNSNYLSALYQKQVLQELLESEE